jgi:hypothetical protein
MEIGREVAISYTISRDVAHEAFGTTECRFSSLAREGRADHPDMTRNQRGPSATERSFGYGSAGLLAD